MNITKSQLKQIILEQIEDVINEADANQDGKLSSSELRGLADEIDADTMREIYVPGYGMLRLGQVRKKLARMLSEAAMHAKQTPPKYVHLNSGMIFALHQALKDNKGLNID